MASTLTPNGGWTDPVSDDIEIAGRRFERHYTSFGDN
jgi:hypothetical protein